MTIRFPQTCPQCKSVGVDRNGNLDSPCIALGTQADGMTHFRCMKCGHLFLIGDKNADKV